MRATLQRPSMGTAVQKFDPKFETLADKRDGEDRAVIKARAKAYKAVERRDGDRCRACFCRVSETAVRRKLQREHHHIYGRGGVEKETTANICLLCVGCHEKKHTRRTLKIEGNADRALRCSDGTREWISLPPNVVQTLKAVGA